MDASRPGFLMRPDHLLRPIDFQQFHLLFACRVARDDGVAVRQSLGTTRILQPRLRQVGIRQLPHDAPLAIHFDRHVSVRAVDQGVTFRKLTIFPLRLYIFE